MLGMNASACPVECARRLGEVVHGPSRRQTRHNANVPELEVEVDERDLLATLRRG